ncbi:myotubularin-related protein 14-like isoform X1 [Branchiostoma floridae]|uniref:Myotubularin-related protein 14-like isoform X1 n=1 Tax=Branchiostoma floridae TaxID=7739 RepID=A0A9J7MQ82_BRAFL|nr:myotubularin-related protein 14-like isoform X1 [Branchiostoma floridae]
MASREDGGKIRYEEIHSLLDFFSKNTFKTKDTQGNSRLKVIHRKCLDLFAKDYKYATIDNSGGELCGHYPAKLVLLEYEVDDATRNTKVGSLYDLGWMHDLFTKARLARCRSRFVVPVMLYEGKHICRSATLASGAEVYGRSGLDFLFSGGESIPSEDGMVSNGMSRDQAVYVPNGNRNRAVMQRSFFSGLPLLWNAFFIPPVSAMSEWQLVDSIRMQDIRLLKALNIGTIVDLMVENKKVKFGMQVTSSEKVDKEHRYADFTLISVPYPGCEFFKDYRDNDYVAEGLVFEWNQGYVDADLQVPQSLIEKSRCLGIDWDRYRSWDLIKLTQNYLRLMLYCLHHGESGLLVHCISGWDRTPLHTSLLRLSLWADGKMHKSLSALEMLYLTIAYDWQLFGHNLQDRLSKGEEIFFFCFNFLKHIAGDEFCIDRVKGETNRPTRSDSEPQFDDTVLIGIEDGSSPARRHRDSSGSMSSIGSMSNCVLDGTTVPFTVGDDSPFSGERHPNGNIPIMMQPMAQRAVLGSAASSACSSPMAVPSKKPTPVEAGSKSGSSVGSWQIVTESGSIRGFTTSRDSPVLVGSESSGSSGPGSSPPEPKEASMRKMRLEEVRCIFLAHYSAVVGMRNGPEYGGGLSGFMGQLASKVGFRARANIV